MKFLLLRSWFLKIILFLFKCGLGPKFAVLRFFGFSFRNSKENLQILSVMYTYTERDATTYFSDLDF